MARAKPGQKTWPRWARPKVAGVKAGANRARMGTASLDTLVTAASWRGALVGLANPGYRSARPPFALSLFGDKQTLPISAKVKLRSGTEMGREGVGLGGRP